MDATVVCIDQTKKSVQVEPRGFRAARDLRSNYQASVIGRAYWARSPRTVIAFSLGVVG